MKNSNEILTQKQQKYLKKQIKTIENREEKQIKAIKEHQKQPIQYNSLNKNTIMTLKVIAQDFFKNRILNKFIDKSRNEILELIQKNIIII